ncbi:MAG: hypothetical protein Q8876_01165 [Bacillota bacterium]|nr:hypothetical protein [Bacillota bacterium]
MKNNAVKVATGGLVSALCMVCMLITNVFPFGTYALPAIAGMLLIFIVIEFSHKWALLVYLSVSILSVFLTADKEAVLFFIVIFGIYPIIKGKIEVLHSKVIQWIFKLIMFNIGAVIAYFVSIYILMIPKDSYNIFDLNLPLVFLLIGNIVFVLYDKGLTNLIIKYVKIWRNKITKR